MVNTLLGISVLFAAQDAAAAKGDARDVKSVHDFTVEDIDGNKVSLDKYKGKALLIVNVASFCGLTDSNYAALNELNDKYAEKGLVILAFPANNFGKQEPKPNAEVKAFCEDKGVKFPLFAKVSVKGDDMCPLYQYLTNHSDKEVAGEVQWNFQKYVVDREGNVVAKFSPRVLPTDEKITSAIDKALAG